MIECILVKKAMSMLSCFFPTTVVLVDDSPHFGDLLISSVNVPNVTFKRFTDPVEALAYINGTCRTNRLDCADLARSGVESTSDWQSIMLNINWLHKEIYNIDRFSRISAVVSDYQMPGMDGIELLSNINDKNIQKVLLTGYADERVAINAFNNGHINRFVKKGVDDFAEEVSSNIVKSVNQYFKIHTGDVSKHLSVYEKTHLNDPIFANFFFNACMSKAYVEYYMVDMFGGYLFLNAKGQPSLLSVFPEHELSKMIDIAEESEDVAPDVLNGLKSGEYMLVYHNRFGQLPPLNEWGNYLKPARRLEGYKTYYFSFAGPESVDVDLESIQSFEKFQKMISI